jgi:hypothetical protein
VGSQLRLIFISSLAVLGTMLSGPAVASAAPTYSQDVKGFHQVVGKRSRPQPAEIALLVGGRAIGTMVRGPGGAGKRFVIANVSGGRVVLVRQTGSRARVKLDIEPICRANPNAPYYLRATVRIQGKLRRAFGRGGDCDFVRRALARNTTMIVRTTFLFEN